jgi:enterobacteria phage integrase
MDVGRPKQHDFPSYMTVDERGGYYVRNPLTGKKRRFSDEATAREAAALLAKWVEQERQARLLDAGRPRIAGLVDAWGRDRMQFEPWDTGTCKQMLIRMRRIRRELGGRAINQTDRMFLEDWLNSFCSRADVFNKWRYALILLWKFAESRKLADICEPEKIEPRSTSKKIPVNRKRRRQLDLEGFKAIHAQAPDWLQLAMEQSLVTLQARQEVCSMRHADYRDGYLFVIRDKVSGDTDMAFIKIRLTPELDEFRRRSLKLDDTASPYLIHRKPQRERREWIEGKPHWTYVNPQYLSKAFERARDCALDKNGHRRYAHLRPKERPTFHEIRGLGARLCRSQGVSEAAIQALMTHASKRTTQVYLERGKDALTSDDYLAVAAPLSARALLSSPGTS